MLFSRPITSYSKVRWLISTLLRNRKLFYRPHPHHPYYLDVGCGPNISDEFYNIDYDWRPGIDRCQDVTKGLYLPAQSLRGVFSEHCFEHIEFSELLQLLRELHAAMRPGAWIRIVVPDAELYCQQYMQSITTENNIMPFHDTIVLENIATPVMSLNRVMRDHGHRFIYDFPTLRALLSKAGFGVVQKLSFGKGNDPKLIRDAPERQVESLYVEARR